LYILKGTPLASLFQDGGCTVLDQETYVEWVAAFLERLSPNMIVQRLTGDPDPSALLVPEWSLDKQQTLYLIKKKLEARETWQGKLFEQLPLDKVLSGSYFRNNL
jgi:hypothetical protein